MVANLLSGGAADVWRPYEPDRGSPWNVARAAHVYRRAGFGADFGQLEDAARIGPAETIRRLFAGTQADEAFEEQMQRTAGTFTAAGDAKNLSAWWLYRMIHAPRQLPEKLTLFWHGHFATSAEKVTDKRLVLAQFNTLRRGALGPMDTLVQAISRDPAMLIYLDSTTNRRIRPNENYARELMELFCLGPGNYTEKDIQEIARCFTGWEVRRGRFGFNAAQHDTGVKSFLAKQGKFDGDDAVRIVLEQPAAARFIAGKLFRFFVRDEPAPEPAWIDALAGMLREDGFRFDRVLRTIFSSRLFYSDEAMGRKIRSPVEMGVGLVRALSATTNTVALAEDLSQLGQALFFPPNVKGWDGGRTWINSQALLGRANMVRRLVSGNASRLPGGSLSGWAQKHEIATAEETVERLLTLLVAVPVPREARAALTELAAAGLRKGPGERDQTLAKVIAAIAVTPEFQLA